VAEGAGGAAPAKEAEPETGADEEEETGGGAVVVVVATAMAAGAGLLFTRAEDVEEAITWWLVAAFGSLFSGLALSSLSVGHLVTAAAAVLASYWLSIRVHNAPTSLTNNAC